MSGLYAIAVTTALMSCKRARFEAEAMQERLRPHVITEPLRARSLGGGVLMFAKQRPKVKPSCCAA